MSADAPAVAPESKQAPERKSVSPSAVSVQDLAKRIAEFPWTILLLSTEELLAVVNSDSIDGEMRERCRVEWESGLRDQELAILSKQPFQEAKCDCAAASTVTLVDCAVASTVTSVAAVPDSLVEDWVAVFNENPGLFWITELHELHALANAPERLTGHEWDVRQACKVLHHRLWYIRATQALPRT